MQHWKSKWLARKGLLALAWVALLCGPPCVSYKMPTAGEKLPTADEKMLPSWGNFFSREYVWGAAEG